MMRNVSRDEARKLLRQFLRQSEFDGLIPALMGWRTGGSTWVNDVPGGRGLKYARVLQGNVQITLIQCINQGGVQDADSGTGEIPIWIKQVEGGRYAIIKERFDA